MLEKCLRLLQAFQADDQPLRFSELVSRTGMAKSTTHRLAHELLDLRLLELDDNGCYVLGLAVFELSGLVPVARRLREVALPFMQDLFLATGETVHLGIRDGYDVVYAEKLHGHLGVDLPSRVGGRLPLTCTGVGKVLLAYAGKDVIDDVMSRPMRAMTPRSVTDPQILRRQLGEIRVTGVVIEREESRLGGACVASPVLIDGRACAALSVSVAIDNFNPGRLAAAVRTAALGISRQLAPSLNLQA